MGRHCLRGDPQLLDQRGHIPRNPSESGVGWPGSKMPVYTRLPRCSTNVPNVCRLIGATVKEGSSVNAAVSMGLLRRVVIDPQQIAHPQIDPTYLEI